MSSDREPLSSILEELFEKYKALAATVNLVNRYNKLWIVLSKYTLAFCFTTSSPVTMRYESLDSVINLLGRTEKIILTSNSH